MTSLCSNSTMPKTNIVIPAPITISIVLICDSFVLVKEHGEDVFFPYDFLSFGQETAERRASKIVEDIVKKKFEENNWTPVDVRSDPKNRKTIHGHSTVEIGYYGILNLLDLPPIPNGYKWLSVDLDNPEFPHTLCLDHSKLWMAARELFLLSM